MFFAAYSYADPIDCTNGCTIITCGPDWSNVYRCNGGDCRLVGGYPADEAKSGGAAKPFEPLYGPAHYQGLNCFDNKCAIKTCSKKQCSVFAFDDSEVSVLATIENMDSVLDEVIEDYMFGSSSKAN